MNPNDPIVLLAQQALKLSDKEDKLPSYRVADAIASLVYAAVVLHKLIMLGVDHEETKRHFMEAVTAGYDEVKIKEGFFDKMMGVLN